MQKGISAILLLVFLPLILLIIAVTFDLGYIFIAKNQLKASVDAAALSGAGGIARFQRANDPSAVEQLSKMFNGGATLDWVNTAFKQAVNIEYPADVEILEYNGTGVLTAPTSFQAANAVRITKSVNLPLFLGGIIGKENTEIRASSAAAVSAPSCAPVAMPLTLLTCGTPAGTTPPVNQDFCEALPCDQTRTWQLNNATQSPDTTDNSAFFGALSGPGSARQCRDWVNGGSSQAVPLCVGDQINLNNGQMTSCLSDIATQCAANNCSITTPWILTVPVVHCNQFRGFDAGGNIILNQNVPIHSFATIGITSVVSTGNPKSITFRFICGRLLVGPPGGSSSRCGLSAAPNLVG